MSSFNKRMLDRLERDAERLRGWGSPVPPGLQSEIARLRGLLGEADPEHVTLTARQRARLREVGITIGRTDS